MSGPEIDLVIRADAGAHIGVGHVMRCLALAQAVQEGGGKVLFATHELPEAMQQRLARENFEVCALSSGNEIAPAIQCALDRGARWMVLDGYHFGQEEQRAVKDAGLRLLVLDDFGQSTEYCADLILNQNIQATADLYAGRSSTSRLLLGTRYALLRREFWTARRPREIASRAQRVLVTFGGGDAPNMTSRALEAMDGLDVETEAIVGPANPNLVALEAQASAHPEKVAVLQNPVDLPDRMQRADLAVSAAGSTCWELAFMGVPQLLVVLAENQRPGAEQLHTERIARNLGWHDAVTAHQIRTAVQGLLHDQEARAAMSERGSRLVDGEGARRVWLEMKVEDVRFRPVTESDSRLIFDWANEPATRAASFSSEPIPWENHRRWFAAKTADSDVHFYIAMDPAGQPLGQVRFDVIGTEALISVSLDPAQRGRGWASAVILAGCRHLFAHRGEVEKIVALVKPDNVASCRSFRTAGFAAAKDTQVGNEAAASFVLWRAQA